VSNPFADSSVPGAKSQRLPVLARIGIPELLELARILLVARLLRLRRTLDLHFRNLREYRLQPLEFRDSAFNSHFHGSS